MSSAIWILLLLAHIFLALGIIVFVLLQADKGSGLSGAFGGGASQTIFGSGGDLGLYGRLTAIFAGLFMVTSFSLYLLAVKDHGSAGAGLRAPRPATGAAGAVPSVD